MKSKETKDLVGNRRALFDYEIIETFEAGIALMGTEVKSLREHSGSLQEAYVKIIRDELWLVGASIPPYRFGNVFNHEERRDRKILMHRKEIERLESAVAEKGMTLIAMAFYLKLGKIKLRIALAKGKKQYDKRKVIKERDEKRTMQRAMKSYK